MPHPKKIQIVNALTEKLKPSPNLVLIGFENIPHQKLEQLRGILRSLNASFQVVKNTLFKVAAQKIGKKELVREDVLKGPSALLTFSSDWSAPLSAFYKFAKNEGQLSFKIGLIDNQIYQKEELAKLAQLPSKEEIMGKILTTIKSPPTRLIYAMKFGMMRVINVLKLKVK